MKQNNDWNFSLKFIVTDVSFWVSTWHCHLWLSYVYYTDHCKLAFNSLKFINAYYLWFAQRLKTFKYKESVELISFANVQP